MVSEPLRKDIEKHSRQYVKFSIQVHFFQQYRLNSISVNYRTINQIHYFS